MSKQSARTTRIKCYSALITKAEELKSLCVLDELGTPTLITTIERNGSTVHAKVPVDQRSANYLFHEFWLAAMGTTAISSSAGAKEALKDFQVWVIGKAQDHRLCRFSAVHNDSIYIPTSKFGKILKITKDGIIEVPNGNNDAKVWIERRPEDQPFTYIDSVNVPEALADFERLCVNSQTCEHESMRWFAAMNCALFPFVKDLATARIIQESIGPTQNGKTTGARRFCLLHGIRDVLGDYSVAAMRNGGDRGFMVMDNKEQRDMTQELINYLMFLATGAESGRSTQDGQIRSYVDRPVAVITTIEGVIKEELKERCLRIPYRLQGPAIENEAIECEIEAKRNHMLSALIQVFPKFLERLEQPLEDITHPVANFRRHLRILGILLHSYSEVALKPAGWGNECLLSEKGWIPLMRAERAQNNEFNSYENILLYVFHRYQDETVQCVTDSTSRDGITVFANYNFKGKVGTLYCITNYVDFLKVLEKTYRAQWGELPRDSAGLRQRIHVTKFNQLYRLTGEERDQLPETKHTKKYRPIAFFESLSPKKPLLAHMTRRQSGFLVTSHT